MKFNNRAEIEAYLAKECEKNPKLRDKLLSHPKETLEKLTGEKLPHEANIHIVEDHGLDFTLVIPQKAKEVEATLAGVSGGAVAIQYGLISALIPSVVINPSLLKPPTQK